MQLKETLKPIDNDSSIITIPETSIEIQTNNNDLDIIINEGLEAGEGLIDESTSKVFIPFYKIKYQIYENNVLKQDNNEPIYLNNRDSLNSNSLLKELLKDKIVNVNDKNLPFKGEVIDLDNNNESIDPNKAFTFDNNNIDLNNPNIKIIMEKKVAK